MAGPNRWDAETLPMATTMRSAARGHLLQRHGVDVENVQRDEECSYKRRAERQRQGKRAGRLANFLGDIGGGIPSAVADIDIKKADEELGKNRDRRGAMNDGGREIGPISCPEGKSENQEYDNDENLGAGENILNLRRALYADAVQDGEDGDQRRR